MRKIDKLYKINWPDSIEVLEVTFLNQSNGVMYIMDERGVKRFINKKSHMLFKTKKQAVNQILEKLKDRNYFLKEDLKDNNKEIKLITKQLAKL